MSSSTSSTSAMSALAFYHLLVQCVLTQLDPHSSLIERNKAFYFTEKIKHDGSLQPCSNGNEGYDLSMISSVDIFPFVVQLSGHSSHSQYENEIIQFYGLSVLEYQIQTNFSILVKSRQEDIQSFLLSYLSLLLAPSAASTSGNSPSKFIIKKIALLLSNLFISTCNSSMWKTLLSQLTSISLLTYHHTFLVIYTMEYLVDTLSQTSVSNLTATPRTNSSYRKALKILTDVDISTQLLSLILHIVNNYNNILHTTLSNVDHSSSVHSDTASGHRFIIQQASGIVASGMDVLHAYTPSCADIVVATLGVTPLLCSFLSLESLEGFNPPTDATSTTTLVYDPLYLSHRRTINLSIIHYLINILNLLKKKKFKISVSRDCEEDSYERLFPMAAVVKFACGYLLLQCVDAHHPRRKPLSEHSYQLTVALSQLLVDIADVFIKGILLLTPITIPIFQQCYDCLVAMCNHESISISSLCFDFWVDLFHLMIHYFYPSTIQSCHYDLAAVVQRSDDGKLYFILQNNNPSCIPITTLFMYLHTSDTHPFTHFLSNVLSMPSTTTSSLIHSILPHCTPDSINVILNTCARKMIRSTSPFKSNSSKSNSMIYALLDYEDDEEFLQASGILKNKIKKILRYLSLLPCYYNGCADLLLQKINNIIRLELQDANGTLRANGTGDYVDDDVDDDVDDSGNSSCRSNGDYHSKRYKLLEAAVAMIECVVPNMLISCMNQSSSTVSTTSVISRIQQLFTMIIIDYNPISTALITRQLHALGSFIPLYHHHPSLTLPTIFPLLFKKIDHYPLSSSATSSPTIFTVKLPKDVICLRKKAILTLSYIITHLLSPSSSMLSSTISSPTPPILQYKNDLITAILSLKSQHRILDNEYLLLVEIMVTLGIADCLSVNINQEVSQIAHLSTSIQQFVSFIMTEVSTFLLSTEISSIINHPQLFLQHLGILFYNKMNYISYESIDQGGRGSLFNHPTYQLDSKAHRQSLFFTLHLLYSILKKTLVLLKGSVATTSSKSVIIHLLKQAIISNIQTFIIPLLQLMHVIHQVYESHTAQSYLPSPQFQSILSLSRRDQHSILNIKLDKDDDEETIKTVDEDGEMDLISSSTSSTSSTAITNVLDSVQHSLVSCRTLLYHIFGLYFQLGGGFVYNQFMSAADDASFSHPSDALLLLKNHLFSDEHLISMSNYHYSELIRFVLSPLISYSCHCPSDESSPSSIHYSSTIINPQASAVLYHVILAPCLSHCFQKLDHCWSLYFKTNSNHFSFLDSTYNSSVHNSNAQTAASHCPKNNRKRGSSVLHEAMDDNILYNFTRCVLHFINSCILLKYNDHHDRMPAMDLVETMDNMSSSVVHHQSSIFPVIFQYPTLLDPILQIVSSSFYFAQPSSSLPTTLAIVDKLIVLIYMSFRSNLSTVNINSFVSYQNYISGEMFTLLLKSFILCIDVDSQNGILSNLCHIYYLYSPLSSICQNILVSLPGVTPDLFQQFHYAFFNHPSSQASSPASSTVPINFHVKHQRGVFKKLLESVIIEGDGALQLRRSHFKQSQVEGTNDSISWSTRPRWTNADSDNNDYYLHCLFY